MLLAIEQGNTNTLFAVHDGKDWIVDVIRNGLLEMAHSSCHIPDDEFSSVMNVAVHTSCSFRIACRQKSGIAVHTDSVVVRLRSGARFAQPWEKERRRIPGLLQRA